MTAAACCPPPSDPASPRSAAPSLVGMDTTDSRRRSTVVSGDVVVPTEACVAWRGVAWRGVAWRVGSGEEKNVYVGGAAVTWPGAR